MGMVTHIYNPNTLRGWGRGSQLWDQLEKFSSLPRPYLKTKSRMARVSSVWRPRILAHVLRERKKKGGKAKTINPPAVLLIVINLELPQVNYLTAILFNITIGQNGLYTFMKDHLWLLFMNFLHFTRGSKEKLVRILVTISLFDEHLGFVGNPSFRNRTPHFTFSNSDS